MGFIRREENSLVEKWFEMNIDKVESSSPYGPLGPERPLDRPWPTPIPGVPFPRRSEEDRMLKMILDKLNDIEIRLDKIEKLLSGRPL